MGFGASSKKSIYGSLTSNMDVDQMAKPKLLTYSSLDPKLDDLSFFQK